jgi:hypothetical protein
MKKIVSTLLAGISAVSLCGVLAFTASDADARTFHHRGGGARIGVAIGAGIIAAPFLYRPYYYGPYGYGPYGYSGYAPYGYGPAYYSPVVVEQPTVYVEQQGQAAGAPSAPPPASAPQAQRPQQDWYFCNDTQTYYPHVQTCASPWQRVAPHAPR